MTQNSFSTIVDKTIRNFIKAVVLIDDHWSEAQNAPNFENIDPTQLNLDPLTIPLQENGDLVVTPVDEENPAPTTSSDDPTYLREIGNEITKQGFLFTGFAYTDARKDIAIQLASKSDILILDWHLGSVDSRPAIALLEELKNSGSPRFVFILTDQDVVEVRKKIIEKLGAPTGGTDLVFSCGPFSFALKNKPQAGGQNTVNPVNVLIEAITGIREQYGGLLQLASLELLSHYKGKLHEVLAHFNNELDVPFIAEWLEDGGPIGPNSCFGSLMIDEWRSLVERDQTSNMSVLSEEGISAYVASKKDNPQWGGESAAIVHGRIEGNQKKFFPTSGANLNEIEQEIQAWMENGESKWPTLTKPKGHTWKSEAIRSIAWSYLSIACGNEQEYREQLVSLDAFFHTQSILPSRLGQGTILQRVAGSEYLVCITPSCDCERPKRIDYRYSFLLADRIPTNSPINAEEGSVIAVRTADNSSFLLRVILKPSLSFQIREVALNVDLNLINPFDLKKNFRAKPIAQLRPARVQSLVSLTAGRAIEVGLDRSELLRQLCKSNV